MRLSHSHLEGEDLVVPAQVLVELTQRMTVDRLRSRMSVTGGAPPPSAGSTSRVQLPYDPSAVLLLEILTSIVSGASGSINELWSVLLHSVVLPA